MSTMQERKRAIADSLEKRTRSDKPRCTKLAGAYLEASLDRAVAVTTDSSPPPTAFKSAQLGLVLSLLSHFRDVPTVEELAALLRVTKSSASSLLNEVLASSDDATEWVLAGVFSRAEKRVAGGGKDKMTIWRFRSAADMRLASERLEFRGVRYATKSKTDGVFELYIEDGFSPPEPQ